MPYFVVVGLLTLSSENFQIGINKGIWFAKSSTRKTVDIRAINQRSPESAAELRI